MTSSKLSADVVLRGDLDPSMKADLFDLYSRYYEPASPIVFDRDLAEKDAVIVLRDGAGVPRGFSTLMSWTASVEAGLVRFIFSGDTVIDRAYWGSQALPFKWLEIAGSIKRSDPSRQLYWLLISKGHRTYRYLPVFARTFFPTFRWPTPAIAKQTMDFGAFQKFGDSYCARDGILHHSPASARLIASYANDEKASLNPDARYFVERNPGYMDGDELVCICELSEANLTPVAQRQFLRGYLGITVASAA